MKIAIILGTRPEIIKMAPVLKELEHRGRDYLIIHTGQHYSYEMDKVFFENLGLREPKANLNVGSWSHGHQTGLMLSRIEAVLVEEQPDLVLVEGDTNSVLAGALAAAKLHIKVGHVEAGLRSYDRHMPEEINRVLVDHISDILFAPTERAKLNLLKEGIDEAKVWVTGNTIVDALFANQGTAERRSLICAPMSYLLVTIHREENTENQERFQTMFNGLENVAEALGRNILFPAHPRTAHLLRSMLYSTRIKVLEPLDYFDFLNLERHAYMILTDSGGVQEEACVLHVPCMTLRGNTERPETVDIGANVVAGLEPNDWPEIAKRMSSIPRIWPNPFGDGNAGSRIVKICQDLYGHKTIKSLSQKSS